MPKLISRNSRIMTEDGAGGWRDATKEDIAESEIMLPDELDAPMRESLNKALASAPPAKQPKNVPRGTSPGNAIQQMGVTAWERFKFKNLANSPEAMKAGLAGLGYEVRPYGGGYNFAVRKGPDDPWRVVDPDGAGEYGSILPGSGVPSAVGEAVLDLADFVVDAVQSFVTGAATTGGAVAGAAIGGPAGAGIGAVTAGGVTGAATEWLRQKAGQAAGIPQDVSAGQVAAVGAVSAAIPLAKPVASMAGRAIRAGGAALGEGTEELAATMTHAQKAGTLSARDVFRARVKDPAAVTEKLPSFAQTVDDVWTGMRNLAKEIDDTGGIPEIIEAGKILSVYDDAAVKLIKSPFGGEYPKANLKTALDRIATLQHQTTAEAAGKKIIATTVPDQAGSVVDDVYTYLSREGVSDVGAAPLAVAERLKSALQDLAASKGAYKGAELEKPLREALTDAARTLRLHVEQLADASSIVGQSGKNYSTLMAEGARKTRMLANMRKALGVNLPAEQGRQRAEQYLASIYGARRSTRLEFVQNFEQLLGIPISLPARRSLIGASIGDEGALGVVPHLGTGLAARMTAPMLALTGVTPRNLVRAARAVPIATGALRPLAAGTGATIRDPRTGALLLGLVQEAAQQAAQPPQRTP